MANEFKFFLLIFLIIFISWIYEAIMHFLMWPINLLRFPRKHLYVSNSLLLRCWDAWTEWQLHAIHIMPPTALCRALLCSSAEGWLQAMLNSHRAVLLCQGFLSSTPTSLGSMKQGNKAVACQAKPTCSDTTPKPELWRPSAAGTDWGKGLDSREKWNGIYPARGTVW